ncbi:MAG: SDR family oxidoreductase [Longimicrobiales bacterium]
MNHGGAGAIRGAVARVFAREGARVFIAGRTQARLDAVTREIAATRGTVEATAIDALDEQAVKQHAAAVAAKAGGIDIALNAVSFMHDLGTPACRHAPTTIRAILLTPVPAPSGLRHRILLLRNRSLLDASSPAGLQKDQTTRSSTKHGQAGRIRFRSRSPVHSRNPPRPHAAQLVPV